MVDPAPAREPREDANAAPPPAPRWVKVLGAIGLVLMVLFVLLHLAGRGFGRHMHGGHAVSTEQTP